MFRTLFAAFSVVLALSSIACATSQQGFPRLDERDLTYYLSSQESSGSSHLYLFSTFLFMNLDKNLVSYDISRVPRKDIPPIITLDIHHLPGLQIQAEFFDFTIWGQLGNYFNKIVESIALENEIINTFRKLEKVNEKYNTLLAVENLLLHQRSIPITLDKANYFYFPQDTERSNLQQDEASSNLVPHSNENRLWQERLKPHIILQRAIPELCTSSSNATVLSSSNPSSKDLMKARHEMDGVLARFFKKLMAAINYLRENMLELLVYLALFILCSGLLKAWHKR